MKWILNIGLVFVIMLSLCACFQRAKGDDISTLSWQEQYDLGVRYLSEGNYKEAIIAFEAVIEVEPGNLDSYYQAAEAYWALEMNESVANVLLRGYAVTGDKGFLWKIATEYEDVRHFLSYTIENVEGTYYYNTYTLESSDDKYITENFGEYCERNNITSRGATCTDVVFDKPLDVSILGVNLKVDHVGVGTTLNVNLPETDGERRVMLSGNIEIVGFPDSRGTVEMLETEDDKLIYVQNLNGWQSIQYERGGFWVFSAETDDSLQFIT